MAAEGQPPAPAPRPVVLRAYAPVRETNWWMISGLMVGLGSVFIGIGFVVLGMGAVATSDYSNYYAAFYSLFGTGVAFIGLSWVFARMTPRMR
jgi:hypothetical protein